jgi:hypothetical protein
MYATFLVFSCLLSSFAVLEITDLFIVNVSLIVYNGSICGREVP